MVYQLGDISFSSQFAPSSMASRKATVFAELPLLEGKPVLQRIADELDNLAFDMVLHFDYCDVSTELNRLEEARQNTAALPLSAGSGEFFGNYVVKAYTVDRTLVSANGTTLMAKIGVVLCEFSDTQVSRFSFAQINDTLAVDVNSPIITTLTPITTDSVQSITAAALSQTAAIEGAAKVEAAQSNALSRDSLIVQATAVYNQGSEAVQTVISTASQLSGQALQIQAYAEAAQVAADSFSATVSALASGDLANAQLNAATVLVATDSLMASGFFLRVGTIARKI